MKRNLSIFMILELTVSANALSLKEEKRMEEWKKYLHFGSVKEKCGKEIPGTPTFAVGPKGTNLESAIKEFFESNAFKNICRDLAEKGVISLLKQKKCAALK